MKPSAANYYRNRAREHRALAERADSVTAAAAHLRIADAYKALARQHRLKQVIVLKSA